MKARLEVNHSTLAEAMGQLVIDLNRRLEKHGRGSFIGSHEIYGVIAEEMDELLEAIRGNNLHLVENELMDVAVAALFGYASLRQIHKWHESNVALSGPLEPSKKLGTPNATNGGGR